MDNYMVYDIGGSSVKWSVINKTGEFLKSGKLPIPDNVDEFFSNLIKNTNENKDRMLWRFTFSRRSMRSFR